MSANSKVEFVNVPGVTVDVARELMLHHLSLAAGYFCVLPQTNEELDCIQSEANRLFYDTHEIVARSILIFCTHMIGASRIEEREKAKVHPPIVSVKPSKPVEIKKTPSEPTDKKSIYDGTRPLTDKELYKLKERSLNPHTCNVQIATNILNVICKRIGRRLVVKL